MYVLSQTFFTYCPRTAGIVVVLLLILLSGCAEKSTNSVPKAERIIEKAQVAHGSNVLDRAVVTFSFRGKQFTVRRDNGLFSYTRTYTDSAGRQVQEVLANDTLYQTVAGKRQALSTDKRKSVKEAVNSVVYFALLPHALDDPAVQSRYLGDTSVDGEPYHEVEVTFQKEGGGRDWEDRFVYWIHRNRHTIDYLAYYYHTGESGSRFRKAVNLRKVEGVRFADYLNYKAKLDTLGAEVEQYDDLFEAGGLEKVSEIVLDSVQVKALPRSSK